MRTGTVRIADSRPGKLLLSAGLALALANGLLPATVAIAQAAPSLPCDIYAAAGTPCVAAHSTVRALYAAYNGPLYQVKRASWAQAVTTATQPSVGSSRGS